MGIVVQDGYHLFTFDNRFNLHFVALKPDFAGLGFHTAAGHYHLVINRVYHLCIRQYIVQAFTCCR